MEGDLKVLGIGFDTNVNQLTADMTKAAASVEHVGDSHQRAKTGVSQLEDSITSLERAQRQRLQTDERVASLQKAGLVGSREYARAIDEQTAANRRLVQEIQRAETASARAAQQQATQARRGGSTTGRIAAGVGIGITAADVGARVASGAVQVIRSSISEASGLVDSARTGTQVFGEYERSVAKFGDTAATKVGLAKREAIDAAAGFGVLFANMNVGRQQAADMSIDLTKLAADLGAVKGTGTAPALEAERSALVGEYDALQRYGVNIDAAAVKQEALREGLIKSTSQALTPAVKAQATYNLMLQQGGFAAGQFQARSGDLSIKTLQLNAAIKDAEGALGKGLTPALIGAAQLANESVLPVLQKLGDAIGFIGEHESTRHLAELALGFVAVKKGLDGIHAAQRFFIGDTAATVAASTAKAAAYTAEGDAAAVAAEKVGALDLAERAGKGSRGGGLLPRVAGLGTKTGVGAAIAAAGALITAGFQSDERNKLLQGGKERGTTYGFDKFSRPYGELAAHNLGSVFDFATGLVGIPGVTGAIDRGTGYSYDMAAFPKVQAEASARAAAESAAFGGAAYQAAQARVGSTRAALDAIQVQRAAARNYLRSGAYKQDAASQALPSLLAELPQKPDVDLGQYRDALTSARLGVTAARDRLRKAEAGSAGASAGQIASARAAVLTAQDAIRKRGGDPAVETLHLQAAQERLSKALQGGKVDAQAVAAAEKGLVDARRTAARATADLHKAEKEASGDKSISLQDILKRASGNAKTSTAEVGNVRALVKAGLTQPVIAELEQLEQTAPGTIAKVAKGLTPAYVAQLNRDRAARDKAAEDLAFLGGKAKYDDLTKQGAIAAKGLAEAQKAAYLADLKDPAWQKAARDIFAGILLPEGTGAPGTAGTGKHAGPQPGSLDDFGKQQAGLTGSHAYSLASPGLVVPPAPVAVTGHQPPPVRVHP